jgi:hypothetical protein
MLLQAEHVPLRSHNGGQVGVMHTALAAWVETVGWGGVLPKVADIGLLGAVRPGFARRCARGQTR